MQKRIHGGTQVVRLSFLSIVMKGRSFDQGRDIAKYNTYSTANVSTEEILKPPGQIR